MTLAGARHTGPTSRTSAPAGSRTCDQGSTSSTRPSRTSSTPLSIFFSGANRRAARAGPSPARVRMLLALMASNLSAESSAGNSVAGDSVFSGFMGASAVNDCCG